MRVLQIMASGERGGGATHLQLLLPALQGLGVEVAARVGAEGPLLRSLCDAGIAASSIALMRRRLSLAGPWEIGRAVRDARPDIVHYHGIRAAFFGALAAPFLASTPGVYTAHGLAYSRPRRDLARFFFLGAERLACARAAHVISVSRADREDLVRRGYVAKERTSHIENPVDARHHARDPLARAAARARLGFCDDELVFVTVARLVPQKAVGDLLEAKARGTIPSRLVVIGDGPQRSELERRAAKLGSSVIFLGERDDVAELWPAFDAFVLSSHWEGEPVALLEAMAAKLPCVATATAEVSRLLADGAGEVVPIGDVTALALALDRLAAGSDEARAARGAKAHARVGSRSPENIARRTLEIYERVLFARGGGAT